MTIVLPTVVVAFAAFCIWLAVRIINRRERWAKWTLAVVVALPALYLASFGPIVWLADHDVVPRNRAAAIYSPILMEVRGGDLLWSYGCLGCRDPFTMLQLWILANVKPSTGEFIDAEAG